MCAYFHAAAAAAARLKRGKPVTAMPLTFIFIWIIFFPRKEQDAVLIRRGSARDKHAHSHTQHSKHMNNGQVQADM